MAQKSGHTRLFLKATAVIALSIGLLLCGLFIGLDLAEKLQREFSTQSRFLKKFNRGFGALMLQERPNRRVVSSNRLDLELTEYFVPFEVKNGAGGIAVDSQDNVFILDLEGKVFRFQDGKTERLNVVTPTSNADALKRQLKAGQLGNISINFGHFRYNDILLHSIGNDRLLLISFTEWHPEKRCFTSTLAKAPVGLDDPSQWVISETDWTIIRRTSPCLPLFMTGFGIKGAEAGGRMISQSPTEILWTSGVYQHDDNFDKTRPGEALAQSDASDYGKVLLVDIQKHTVRAIAKGLRNPQGIDFDASGNPLVTDHGMRGGDELNLLHRGANFGFPLVTLGTKYTKLPGGSKPYHSGHEGFDKPMVAFVPSIAPSSVLYLDGFHPNWDGDILVGGLRRQLHRVYREAGQILFVEPIDLGIRIRDMAQLSDGRIVLYSDDKKLVLIAPNTGSFQYEKLQSLLAGEPDLELRRTAHDALNSCLECHSVEENETGAGPTLFRVCGRRPGTTDFSGYSGALEASIDLWDYDSLLGFISDPPGIAPGTNMMWDAAVQPEVAGLIAKILCHLDADP